MKLKPDVSKSTTAYVKQVKPGDYDKVSINSDNIVAANRKQEHYDKASNWTFCLNLGRIYSNGAVNT